MKLSKYSEARIESFVHDFIRGREVEALTSDRDGDFINYPERAERCYDAAEHGADGKTHSEVIEDWRDAFSEWMRGRNHDHDYTHFEAAVRARFDKTEQWHEENGSLDEEIG